MKILVLIIMCFCMPEKSLIGQSHTQSTIVGKIELPEKIFQKKRKRKRRSRRYKRRVKNLQKKAKKYSEYEKTVIYLKPLNPKNNIFIKRDAELYQKFISFTPAHVVIQKGNRIAFINEDDLFHNVYSSCCSEKFNIGKKRTGVKAYELFDKVNHLQVFCDIHADMSALISIVDSPYYTTCNEKGLFKIDKIPDGEYQIIGWHPRAEYQSSTISIQNGKTIKVKLEFN